LPGSAADAVRAVINFLYTITLFELFVGGGGRLTEVGPVTLRMIFFALLLMVGSFACFRTYRRGNGVLLAVELVICYLIVHLPALVMGDWQGALSEDVIPEFQQSLYWLAAPVFALVLQSPNMVRRTALVVKSAGIVLALTYIFVVIGILSGKVNFASLYLKLHETGEIVARGETFLFYKGFLYLGIAIIFFVATRPRFWVVSACLLGLALVMTLTRGFVAATSLALLLLLAFQRRRVALAIGVGAVAIGGLLLLVYLPTDTLIANRELSTVQRLDDMKYMLDHVSASTVFFGEGFGTPINDRGSVENTFLWALWRMGVAGVVFWLIPFALCLLYFLRIPGRRSNGLACAYFFGIVLVYIETATNPYLNNPIGLSYAMAALFSLRTLSVEARRSETADSSYSTDALAAPEAA
jgi:hypothetical protein